MDEKRQLPNVDTIIAVSEVANAFHAQFVPFFINSLFSYIPTGDNSGLETQLQLIFYSNCISLAAIIFLIFVPWKKGPECYLKFSPIIFYALMYLNYVILPVGNMGLSTYFTLNPNYDLKIKPLESWVIFFTVVCFSRVFEFFSSIKKIVLDDARIFLQTRKVLLEG
jgi:hypothetical protein